MLKEIQAKVQSTTCPYCSSQHTLEARMRCDLSPKSCMLTLHCNHCDQEFIMFDEMNVKHDCDKASEVEFDMASHRCYLSNKKAS